MVRQVKLPDGKVAKFSDDTPDDVLHSFAKDYIDNNLVGNKERQNQSPNISKTETAARSAAQGYTFGFADEFEGAARNLGVKAARSVEKAIYGNNIIPQTSYKEQRDITRQRNLESENINPKTAFFAELGGSIANPANKFLFGNAKTYKDVAKGSAAFGASYGAGKTEDFSKPGQTLLDIGVNTALSTAGGAAGKSIVDLTKLASKPITQAGTRIASELGYKPASRSIAINELKKSF
jgi:hypothetical protein